MSLRCWHHPPLIPGLNLIVIQHPNKCIKMRTHPYRWCPLILASVQPKALEEICETSRRIRQFSWVRRVDEDLGRFVAWPARLVVVPPHMRRYLPRTNRRDSVVRRVEDGGPLSRTVIETVCGGTGVEL